MKTKDVGIVGMGYYVPENIMTNFDFEKIIDTSDEWIRTRTGIKERRFATEGINTSDLATEAAKKALETAKISPEAIDLIIVATGTPDYLIQNTASLVQEKLGALNAAAFDLNAACSGFVYALTVGESMIKAGMYKTVMVIGAEIYSRILDMEDRNTCILFGDGAAAAVLSEVEEGMGILASYLGAEGEDKETLRTPAGGSANPITKERVENREIYIRMKGQEVFKFAVKALPKATEKVLIQAKLQPEDINMVVPHQANYRIIDSASKRLGIPVEKFYLNLDRYGNTSSASIGIALGEALEKGLVKKGDIIALTGFGAGLTYGSIVMRWAY